MPIKPRKGKKRRYTMIGGPLDGCKLVLDSAGTMPFTMAGQTGHYDQNNKWVEIKKESKNG